MSTRSMVAMKIGDKYKAIYVHFDGYIEGVGRILCNHYYDPKKIEKLILKGDRSCLSDIVDDEVYDDQYKIECDTLEELFKKFKEMWTEYLYLYEDCHWKVLNKYDTPAVFKDLRSELGVEEPKEESQKDKDDENYDDSDISDKLMYSAEMFGKIVSELFDSKNDDLTIKEFREKLKGIRVIRCSE